MAKSRYLEKAIREDLPNKMVFVAGPRQVGKTTMAKSLLIEEKNGRYLNWDNRDHRRQIRQAAWPAGSALVVLDELHKWRGWKSWIKGEFDVHSDRLRFLVTGSARLDIYRSGGDSLQGRYHHYRLHPFSFAEVERPGHLASDFHAGIEFDFATDLPRKTIDALMRFGGFPEPFLGQSPRTLRRWQKERVDRVLLEDVRDLEEVRATSQIQILADLLPERVGSPLSLNSLREDLDASHRAVSHWMDILDRLYYSFRILPWASTRVRSLKRMPKLYLWDWSEINNPGARFENLVAVHLLKFCHFIEDRDGHRVELWYLRDRAGHEIDFLVTHEGQPWFAVEAKLGAERIDPSFRYFGDRLELPQRYQVVFDGKRNALIEGVHILPAHVFLSALV
jgi:predicted AAA+ superfamily ATPase